jgi:hypothetical protein
MAAKDVLPCVKAFILAILCGNPILKGAFTTVLSSLVLQLDEEIAVLTLEANQLNILNRILNIEIQLVQAAVNKVQADLNLLLAPLSAANNCPTLSKLNTNLQQNAVSKKFVALQNKIAQLNRRTNLTQYLDTVTKKKNKLRQDCLDMIDAITSLCG